MPHTNDGYFSSEDSSHSSADDDDDDRQQFSRQGFGDEDEEEEEEEEGFLADDAQSQVTFDDENIMPGGLNPFSVMLPPQAERLFRKDLPKPVIADRILKSNYRATILKLNSGIEQLVNKVLAENNSARSIWNSVNVALKKGYKSLDAKAKQVAKLQDDLAKTKTRLENALEKVRDESNKRESAIREKKDALESLQTKTESMAKIERDLVDVRRELDEMKREAGDSSGSYGQKAMVKSGDELDRLREKKRIENEAYADRLKLQREDKERGEKRKRDKKKDSVSTIQAIGGGGHPFFPATSRDKSKRKSKSKSKRSRRGKKGRKSRRRSPSSSSDSRSSRVRAASVVRAAAAVVAAAAVRAAGSAIVGAVVSIRVGVGAVILSIRVGAIVMVERRATAIKMLLIRASPLSLPLLTITSKSNSMLHPSPVQMLDCNSMKHAAFRFQVILLPSTIQIWMLLGLYSR
jgi:hypothetical protein